MEAGSEEMAASGGEWSVRGQRRDCVRVWRVARKDVALVWRGAPRVGLLGACVVCAGSAVNNVTVSRKSTL